MILKHYFDSALFKQSWLTLVTSLCFLVIGLVRAFSSSSLPSIEAYDTLLIQTQEQKSWIGSIPPVGAVIGSIVSGPLMARVGRRTTLMVATPLWCVSWLTLAFAPNLTFILIGRFSTGLCVGLVLATVQVYVGECCEANIRGRLGSIPTLSMSLGILLSYIFGYSVYWRNLAIIGAGFSIFAFGCLFTLPESPVWLDSTGRKGGDKAAEWLHLQPKNCQTTNKEKEILEENDIKSSLFTREVFFSQEIFHPFIISFALLVFQQVSGIDSIIFFTVEIFKTSGSSLDAKVATIYVGAVQLVCGSVSTVFIDRAGRKPLLLASTATTAVAMTAMGVSYYLEHDKIPWLGYLPIISLVVFMFGYSIGLAGVPFLLLGELFPTQYRSQLSSVASAFNLLTMFAVIKTYHIFEHLMTPAGTFWFYACCSALGFMFVLFLVPETKGKTLEEIEAFFSKKSKAIMQTEISSITVQLEIPKC